MNSQRYTDEFKTEAVARKLDRVEMFGRMVERRLLHVVMYAKSPLGVNAGLSTGPRG